MNRLPARKQLFADYRMRQWSRAKQGPRYRQGLFSVIGGLPNPPFISTVAGVAWDNVPWTPVESADPMRVPAQHAGMGERLGLFADGIPRGESFETGDGSFCVIQRVVRPGHVILQHRDGFQKPARMRAWAGLHLAGLELVSRAKRTSCPSEQDHRSGSGNTTIIGFETESSLTGFVSTLRLTPWLRRWEDGWLSVSLPREGPRLVAIVAIRKAYREAKLKEASSKLPKVIRGASGRAGRHEGKILHLTLGRSSP